MKRFTVPLAASVLLLLSIAAPPAFASLAPPTISATSFSEVTTTSAALSATVNPNERKVTDYHFQYITQSAWEADGETFGAGTQTTGVGEISTELSSPHQVSAAVAELIPGTAYRFRLFAHNNQGDTLGEELTFYTYANPPGFGPCPNDAYRTGVFASLGHPSASLPDCRAYEQASPVAKDGQDVGSDRAMDRAAPDGSAISFLATNGIPGGLGGQAMPSFLARRGADGWSTAGTLPPAPFGDQGFLAGWTPDFSTLFSVAERIGLPGQTLLASVPGGSITTIAPYSSGFQAFLGAGNPYVGTGAGGSPAFFESSTKLAGAAGLEGHSNVYGWDRETSQLSLAAALNGAPGGEGQAPPKGAFAGPYDWISSEDHSAPTSLATGGAAAQYYTQEEHAVSEDGSLYFTEAGSGQLFRRLNPTQSQSAFITNGQGEEECIEPAKACTVHISASEKTNGGGEDGHDVNGARPAAFLQATPDGEKALFMSPEKLTNNANTGPEPTHAAAIASANKTTGEEVDIEFLPAHAKGIAFSGGHVYWADPTGHQIGRAALDGEGNVVPGSDEPHFIVPPETSFETHPLTEPGVIHSAPATPRYVAVDAEHVYWTNTGPIGGDREVNGKKEKLEPEQALAGAGTIGWAELDGAEDLVAGSVEAELIEGASNPQGIALGPCSGGGNCIYWANEGDSQGSSAAEVSSRTIGRAKLNGEEAAQGFIQVDSPGSFERPQGLAVDGSHIYASINGGFFQDFRYLARYSLDGSGSTFLFDNQEGHFAPGLRGITVDSEYLYWARQGGDSIGRIPLSALGSLGSCKTTPGCEPEFIAKAGGPQGLAISGSQLYWSANQEVAPNPGNDLYLYDAKSPTGHRLTDLTVDTEDEDGAQVVGVLGASEDLSYIYFAANGDLDGPGPAQPGDCRGAAPGGRPDYHGQCSLYLAHEGAVSFIARLEARPLGENASDATNWLVGHQGVFTTKASRVSPDGHTLLFTSQAKLTGYDNDGSCGAAAPGKVEPGPCAELYRYRAGQSGLLCVSCDPSGEAPRNSSITADLGEQDIGFAAAEPTFGQSLTRALSADGQRVFFDTDQSLVPADTDASGGCPPHTQNLSGGLSAHGNYRICRDAYEWEAPGTPGGSCEAGGPAYSPQNGGCLYLLTPGDEEQGAFFIDASESGDDAFVLTRAPLVGQDGDSLFDVYDAGVGGGFASQNKPPVVPCEGEAGCRPASSQPPAQPSPASAGFSGPSNPKPKPQKPRPRCTKRKGSHSCRHARGRHRHKGRQHR